MSRPARVLASPVPAPSTPADAPARLAPRLREARMQTVYSPRHAGHGGNVELNSGAIVPAYELPRRAEIIRARVEEVGLGPILAPSPAVARHRPPGAPRRLPRLPAPRLAALGRGRAGPARRCPSSGRARPARRRPAPTHVDGLLGFYSFDAGATFVAGTWDAIQASHDVALTAADLVAGRRAAPPSRCAARPGTTPAPRAAGGYCYVNNAAVAAERLREAGAGARRGPRRRLPPRQRHPGHLLRPRRRVGRQRPRRPGGGVSLFPRPRRRARDRARRGLQPQPAAAARDRLGGAGAPRSTPPAPRSRRFAPDALVVSLGVDTFQGDPISEFRLDTPTFRRSARACAGSACRPCS